MIIGLLLSLDYGDQILKGLMDNMAAKGVHIIQFEKG